MENKFIIKSGRKLRLGYTTGSCATAAAKSSAIMLLTGRSVENVKINLPEGKELILDIEEARITEEFASCCVVKDSGDDPDITNGIKIYAKVEKTLSKIEIVGGKGVGRVTRSGLSCKVGESAINPVPREMILKALLEVTSVYSYQGGLKAVISIPNGEEIAQKTFNPRLGIEGGLSILGTTGIVEPMSEKALIETIHLEIDSMVENKKKILQVSPGNFGVKFSKEILQIDNKLTVKCSNYIGETVDYAVYKGIEKILLAGHIGKLVKLAAGVMNTHSKVADCRNEIFAAHYSLFKSNPETVKKIMNAITTDEIHAILNEEKIADVVYKSIEQKIIYHLNLRSGNKIEFEMVIFSNLNGILIKTRGVEKFIEIIR